MFRLFLVGCLSVSVSVSVSVSWLNFSFADGPRDNHPESVRRVPKLGIELSAEQRAELSTNLDQLGEAIANLKKLPADVQRLLPDVEIYHRAVSVALEHQEFFAPNDVRSAHDAAVSAGSGDELELPGLGARRRQAEDFERATRVVLPIASAAG